VSRIGKQPIAVPDGVQVQIEPEIVRVNGPRGELAERKNRDIVVEQQNGDIVVTRPTDRKEHRALHGLTRSLIANMIEGVTSGFEKRLEIQGVGYRAALKGKNIELSVGYSHPVQIDAPDGVEFEVPQPTQIIVKGSSKQVVGEIAAQIRKVRPPEPYKGKGIRYVGEHVQRTVGKRAGPSRRSPSRGCAAAAACGRRCAATRTARGCPSSVRTAASGCR
jgi:large subunit ribosomal protein L6